MSVPVPDREDLMGADLRLLGDLLVAEQRERGADLIAGPRAQAAVAGSDELRHDLVRVEGFENLQQALLLRFLTEVGELAHLGHPDYGSRLHELVGEPNTEGTRHRAKLFTLQALAQEPRVVAVRSVTVTTDLRDRTLLQIRASVVAVDLTDVEVLVPVSLTGRLS